MGWSAIGWVVLITSCVSTRPCPVDTHRIVAQSATRAEWCASSSTGAPTLTINREAPFPIIMPAPIIGTVRGPYSEWHSNGVLKTHGHYAADREDGSTSVADGVWAMWNFDGRRAQIGRFDRGQPIGCFGALAGGIWKTAQISEAAIRVEPCDPPQADLLLVERRQRTSNVNARWGDITARTSVHDGPFGASNPTQQEPTPSALISLEGVLHKQLRFVRVGPALGVRLSSGNDTRGFQGGVDVAIGGALVRRVEGELALRLALTYLEVTARRPDIIGARVLGFWDLRSTARFGVAVSISTNVQVVTGVAVDSSPIRNANATVGYFPGLVADETWRIGGTNYSLDFGLRLVIR